MSLRELSQTRVKSALPFRRRYKRFRVWLISLLMLFGVVVPATFVAYVLWEMPSLQTLENPNTDLSTQVFSADKQLMGTFYRTQNRVNVRFTDLPKHLRDALIASEDIRFEQHSGIDPVFVFTAPFRFATGDIRGGSTLTQQLARNLYNDAVGFDRSVVRKVKEAIVATYLERRYTKPEILTLYLNTVSFGGTVYGVEAASKAYFDKGVREINRLEAATLVGMLQATSAFNPVRNPRASRHQRNLVLSQMNKYGFITQTAYVKDTAQPLVTNASILAEEHSEGLAPHFRAELQKWLRDWCAQHGQDMYTSGLRVYTTLNSRMQRHAETASVEHMRDLQKTFDKHLAEKKLPWEEDPAIIDRAYRQSARYAIMKAQGATEAEIKRAFQRPGPMRLFAWNDAGYIERTLSPWDSIKYYAKYLQPGFIVIQPQTGHVLAWVGGLDHRFFKYDHVKQSRRQVGSTFKPFVYTAAFDNGFSPCHQVLNMPVTIEYEGQVWSPRNSDRNIGGEYTLRKGLALSMNTITAQVMKQVGPRAVAEYAYRMGITSKLDVVPSLALGTTDLSVYELTSAYATYADAGRWHEPLFVARIEDKFGNVLEEFVGNSREALSEQTAYLMVDMLRGVVNEGTAGALRWKYNIPQGVDMGGKTGTTQNHADGWFVGITPQFAAGVWVGASDRSVRFRDLRYGQGGYMAMPIWGRFAQLVYEDTQLALPKTFFTRPPNMTVEIDCKKYRALQGSQDDTTNTAPQGFNFED